MIKNKKGQIGIGGIPNFVWALVQIGIFVAIGLIVLAQFEATTDNVDASNAINATITAVDDVPAWIPILVVMLMAGVVVALVQIFRSR